MKIEEQIDLRSLATATVTPTDIARKIRTEWDRCGTSSSGVQIFNLRLTRGAIVKIPGRVSILEFFIRDVLTASVDQDGMCSVYPEPNVELSKEECAMVASECDRRYKLLKANPEFEPFFTFFEKHVADAIVGCKPLEAREKMRTLGCGEKIRVEKNKRYRDSDDSECEIDDD